MWNDTDIPLAYLITFRCYGTWLHGDDRGSVDREHNRYHEPYALSNENRNRHNARLLKSEPVVLDTARRASVELAIRETCKYRRWALLAVNVRTNHAHVVVSIGEKKPQLALNAFKANATRQMREDGCWSFDYSPWVDKGSCRYLWNERSVERAIDYVINGQGDELPDFD
jgi:REP element-mobilizing transposase RayT